MEMRLSGALSGIGGTRLVAACPFTLQNSLVEGVKQTFPRGVGPWSVDTRLNSRLRQFRNPPVFAVCRVPEFDGVIREEVGFGQFRRMEMPFANDLREVDGLRP